MTFGELFVEYWQTIASLFCVCIVLKFYYNGHNIVRRILLFARNFVKNTVDAFHGWVDVFDEALLGKDEDNGRKDM